MIRIIKTGTKHFETKFGIGDNVKWTWDDRLLGSIGYVYKIIIDENGIQYGVILTSIAGQSDNVLRPQRVVAEYFMLEEL